LLHLRQIGLDEFEILWNAQSQHHPELTDDLKKKITAQEVELQKTVTDKLEGHLSSIQQELNEIASLLRTSH
jgi:hypothetical protein